MLPAFIGIFLTVLRGRSVLICFVWLKWFWFWLEGTAGSCSEGAETSAADGDEQLGINICHQYCLHKVGVCSHPKFSAGLKEGSGEREAANPWGLTWCGKLSMFISHSLLFFPTLYIISSLEYRTQGSLAVIYLRKTHLNILSVKELAEILLHGCKKMLRIHCSLLSFFPLVE